MSQTVHSRNTSTIKTGTISVKTYFDSSASTWSRKVWNGLYDGDIMKSNSVYRDNGVKRYLTGLNEFALK